MSNEQQDLKAFFDLKVEEDDNVIATYTDADGNLVVLVLDDEPEKLSTYVARGKNVKFIKSAPFKAYQNPTGRFRPAPGGVSTGSYRITAGTLSMVVRDKTNGALSVLSNNHVYANVDSCSVGDDLLQPGQADDGDRPADTIADLTRWVPMKGTGVKKVDCAIGKVQRPEDVSLNILGIGYCYGVVSAFIDQKIWKSGRTTGIGRGRIIAIDVTAQIDYGSAGTIVMTDCIVSDIRSAGGDSGSSLLDFASNKCVGLLFAGNGQVTIGCKATNVFSMLNIETIEPPEIMRSFWLDLSKWQGDISSLDDIRDYSFKANIEGLTPSSFSKMKEMGVRGVIMKVCQGANIIDPKFSTYYEYAKNAGLLVSGYIFVDPSVSADAHYSNFLAVVGDRKFDVPLALDCEITGGQSPQAITSVIQNLAELVTSWYKGLPFLYSSQNFWNTNVLPWAGWKYFPLWMAYWSNVTLYPAVPRDWVGVEGKPEIWQYDVNDNGAALGVGSEKVDTNVTFRSFEKLLGEPTPPPPTLSTSASASASPSPSEPPSDDKAVFEHYKGKATVNLNYRNGPGTQYTLLGTMKVGTTVEILETKPDTTSNIWARIGYNQWAAQLYRGQEYIRYILQSD